MAQNITLLGASYSAVPAVQLPKTGGGTARFDDATVTTATASDVATGKVFLASDGTITTGTSSGGGGASNIVMGTFTGTTTGAAMDVTLNYNGSGYPIVAVIYPTGGPYYANAPSDSNAYKWYNLIQNRAIAEFFLVKSEISTTPDYSDTDSFNNMAYAIVYKNSTSSGTSYTRASGQSTNALRNTSSGGANAYGCVKFKSSTTMSVFIKGTSPYGFAPNIEYTYHVIYSS